jgi:hypothetical protein
MFCIRFTERKVQFSSRTTTPPSAGDVVHVLLVFGETVDVLVMGSEQRRMLKLAYSFSVDKGEIKRSALLHAVDNVSEEICVPVLFTFGVCSMEESLVRPADTRFGLTSSETRPDAVPVGMLISEILDREQSSSSSSSSRI